MALLALWKSEPLNGRPLARSAASTNPQAAYAIDPVGPDATPLSLARSLPFAGREMAGEMGCATSHSRRMQPPAHHRRHWRVARYWIWRNYPGELFRGETARDRRGQFASQLSLRDIPYGLTPRFAPLHTQALLKFQPSPGFRPKIPLSLRAALGSSLANWVAKRQC